MVDYSRLWTLMAGKKISLYQLITRYKISASTIHTMKHGGYIRTSTLEKLCVILSATPGDLVSFQRDHEL